MATTQKSRIRFNYRDYQLMPEDKRCELIDGDFYMTPSPVTLHQRISMRIAFDLTEYVRKNNLGETFIAPMDVVLSDEDVLQPDIFYISKERKNIVTPENIRGAPDLVIEILSRSTAERDRVVKSRLYARFGVQEYWIVDPDQKTVQVMGWSEDGFKTIQVYPEDATLHSPILPQLLLPLKPVFGE